MKTLAVTVLAMCLAVVIVTAAAAQTDPSAPTVTLFPTSSAPAPFVLNGLQMLQANGVITDLKVMQVTIPGASPNETLVVTWNDKRAAALPNGNACMFPYGAALNDCLYSGSANLVQFGSWNTYTLNAKLGKNQWWDSQSSIDAPIFTGGWDAKGQPISANNINILKVLNRGQLVLPSSLDDQQTQLYADAIAQSLAVVPKDSASVQDSARVTVISNESNQVVATADSSDQGMSPVEFWFDIALAAGLVGILGAGAFLFPGVRILLLETLCHPGLDSVFSITGGKILVTHSRR